MIRCHDNELIGLKYQVNSYRLIYDYRHRN
jgi:hypothetical protein